MSIVPNYSTITISLINETQFIYNFDHAVVGYPGNSLIIDKKKLYPGETATIIGTTTTNFDLIGFLYFDENIIFHIFVPLQFHYGQPIFKINANHTNSIIQSKILNPDIEPRLLLYSVVTIILKTMN